MIHRNYDYVGKTCVMFSHQCVMFRVVDQLVI